jgi:hypothetical protein
LCALGECLCVEMGSGLRRRCLRILAHIGDKVEAATSTAEALGPQPFRNRTLQTRYECDLYSLMRRRLLFASASSSSPTSTQHLATGSSSPSGRFINSTACPSKNSSSSARCMSRDWRGGKSTNSTTITHTDLCAPNADARHLINTTHTKTPTQHTHIHNGHRRSRPWRARPIERTPGSRRHLDLFSMRYEGRKFVTSRSTGPAREVARVVTISLSPTPTRHCYLCTLLFFLLALSTLTNLVRRYG